MTCGSFLTRSIHGLSETPARIFPISDKSMPAQKVSPRPVRIATRSVSSRSSCVQASYSRHITSQLTAFFFSGRFSVTTRTWSSFSTITAGDDMTLLWARVGEFGAGAR